MITELTLAIMNQVPLEVLANTVHCYPTQAEVFQYPTQAEVFQRIALQHARPQRVAVPHPR